MGKSQKWAEWVHPCVDDQGLLSALTNSSENLHRAWQSQCDCCALCKFSERFVNKNGWLWVNEILQDFSLRCTFYSHCYEYGTQKIQTPATACLKNHALFMVCCALLWFNNDGFSPFISLALGHSYDSSCASDVTLNNLGKCITFTKGFQQGQLPCRWLIKLSRGLIKHLSFLCLLYD